MNYPLFLKIKALGEIMEKIELGQFYTKQNCFMLEPFKHWVELLRNFDHQAYNSVWCEPFAGAKIILNSTLETMELGELLCVA